MWLKDFTALIHCTMHKGQKVVKVEERLAVKPSQYPALELSGRRRIGVGMLRVWDEPELNSGIRARDFLRMLGKRLLIGFAMDEENRHFGMCDGPHRLRRSQVNVIAQAGIKQSLPHNNWRKNGADEFADAVIRDFRKRGVGRLRNHRAEITAAC